MQVCAALLATVLDSKPLAPHLTLRAAIMTDKWGLVCQALERYGVAGAQSPPSCMQDAYNHLLAAYRHYGRDSTQTRDAAAAAARLDPAARVPQLLAGLHYPCITNSPGVVQGMAAEALAYCRDYGEFWSAHSDSGILASFAVLMNEGVPREYSPQLIWLLKQRDIQVPTKAQQAELWSVRCLVEGHWNHCMVQTWPHAEKVMTHVVQHGRPENKPLAHKADTLRGAAVFVATFGSIALNLPPVSVAPRLWHHAAGIAGYPNVVNLLTMVASVLVPVLSTAMCDLARMEEQELRQRVGFSLRQEPSQLIHLLRTLPIIGVRCHWQLGDAGTALKKARMLQHTNALHTPSVTEIQQARAAPGAGGSNAASSSSSSSSHTAGAYMMASAGGSGSQVRVPVVGEPVPLQAMQPIISFLEGEVRAQRTPQQQAADKQLYSMFPRWLDQLLSQVVGRKVALVIDPHHAADPDEDVQECAIYLKEADGRRQPFCWKQRGDADTKRQLDWLVQQAVAQGAANMDLVQRFPTLEMQLPPMPQLPAAASSSGPAAPTAAPAAAPPEAAAGAGGSRGGSRPCAYCGQLFAKTKRCARCKKVWYCSEEHQRAHWKAAHKRECAELAEQQK